MTKSIGKCAIKAFCFTVLAIFTLFAAFFMTGCASNSDSSGKPEAGKVFERGDKIELGDVVFAMPSFSAISGDDGVPPGSEVMLINIYLENKGKKQAEIGADNFVLRNSAGTVYLPDDSLGGSYDSLQSEMIEPGRKIISKVVFIVPEDDKSLTLVFSPNWTDSEAIVKLFFD